jgi:hypothetical protein
MTLIAIQEKLMQQEIRAIQKHGKTVTARSVIFSARTRAKNSLSKLGLTRSQCRQAITDAADMALLQLEAQ